MPDPPGPFSESMPSYIKCPYCGKLIREHNTTDFRNCLIAAIKAWKPQ